MRFRHLFRLSLGVCVLLSSCSLTNRLLKAKPAKLTPFFEQPEMAQDGRRQFGFQKVWTTSDTRVQKEALAKTKLHIAPVTVGYLRPVERGLAGGEVALGSVKRHERGIAKRLHQEFTRAFQRSPQPFYHLSDQTGRDTLILQLALTELTPTSAKGNAITTAVKFILSPVLAPFTSLGGFFTKGHIAIEGKLLVPMPARRGKDIGPPYRPFFQFADREADKLTLFSLRDYQSYGHAVRTIRHWAVHFEQMSRAQRGQKVRDSSAVTLRPY